MAHKRKLLVHKSLVEDFGIDYFKQFSADDLAFTLMLRPQHNTIVCCDNGLREVAYFEQDDMGDISLSPIMIDGHYFTIEEDDDGEHD